MAVLEDRRILEAIIRTDLELKLERLLGVPFIISGCASTKIDSSEKTDRTEINNIRERALSQINHDQLQERIKTFAGTPHKTTNIDEVMQILREYIKPIQLYISNRFSDDKTDLYITINKQLDDNWSVIIEPVSLAREKPFFEFTLSPEGQITQSIRYTRVLFDEEKNIQELKPEDYQESVYNILRLLAGKTQESQAQTTALINELHKKIGTRSSEKDLTKLVSRIISANKTEIRQGESNNRALFIGSINNGANYEISLRADTFAQEDFTSRGLTLSICSSDLEIFYDFDITQRQDEKGKEIIQTHDISTSHRKINIDLEQNPDLLEKQRDTAYSILKWFEAKYLSSGQTYRLEDASEEDYWKPIFREEHQTTTTIEIIPQEIRPKKIHDYILPFSLATALILGGAIYYARRLRRKNANK